MSISNKPLKLLASTAAAALLIGWAAGVGAQAADPQPQLPPLPQAGAAPQASTAAPLAAPQPLGQDDVREVQSQLIALGYNPGPADGQLGPSTTTAAEQYDHAHGGTGQAPVDSALLARLKADTGPRLSYEQVQERSGGQAQASAPASSGASQFGGIVNQILPLVSSAIANSNNNQGYYYGPPPPGYYHPAYGYGYGGY
jgi:peptidoglycan hydrolase-like protein with peptidoglycan-binding domain